MLPWQRAPDNATSKYRNNSTLAKNDFGRLFLSRAQVDLQHFPRRKIDRTVSSICARVEPRPAKPMT